MVKMCGLFSALVACVEADVRAVDVVVSGDNHSSKYYINKWSE